MTDAPSNPDHPPETGPKDGQTGQSGGNELARRIEADAVPNLGKTVKIEATATECRDLARRFGINAVNRLKATLKVTPVQPPGTMRVTGTIDAEVEQSCVVTLEPVTNTVLEDVSVEFGPIEEVRDIELTLEDDDPIEPLENGGIELGELVAQNLALGLDPYPRLSDADLKKAAEKSSGVTVNQPTGPFAELAKLQSGEKE